MIEWHGSHMNTDVATQIEYWDRVAGEKSFSHPLRLDWLKRGIDLSTRHSTIVDYGCGYGRTLKELWRNGYHNIVGIDFSTGMLMRSRSELPRVPLVRSDGRTLPLRADSVAVVLLFAVLTCIPESDEQQRLIAGVSRVLQPGGLLYISDLLMNEDERNRARYEEYVHKYGCYGVFELPEGVVVRHHRKQWIEELTGAFETLGFEPFVVTTMNGNTSAAFQYLGRKRQNLE